MSWRWQDAMEALLRPEWWKILGGQGKQGNSILRSEEYEWTHLRPVTNLKKETLGPLRTCDLHEDTNIPCFLKFKSVLAVFILYVWMFGLHYMNVYQMAYLVPKEVREGMGLLETGVMDVCEPQGTGNWTQDLWKSGKCSYQLTNSCPPALSSLIF